MELRGWCLMFIAPTEYWTLSKISQIIAPQMHNGLSDATPLATNMAQWAKDLSLVLPLLSFGLQQGDQRITIAKSSLCQSVICVFFYKHLFRWQLLERGNLPNHCRSAVFNIIMKKTKQLTFIWRPERVVSINRVSRRGRESDGEGLAFYWRVLKNFLRVSWQCIELVITCSSVQFLCQKIKPGPVAIQHIIRFTQTPIKLCWS